MDNTLGSHIRKIRRNNNLTLKRLARKAEVSVPYLSAIENGSVNPSILMLESIAEALQITLAEIVDYKSDIKSLLDTKIADENKQLKKTVSDICKLALESI